MPLYEILGKILRNNDLHENPGTNASVFFLP